MCDPIWQVTLRSSVMDLSIKSYTYLYLFTFRVQCLVRPKNSCVPGYCPGYCGEKIWTGAEKYFYLYFCFITCRVILHLINTN